MPVQITSLTNAAQILYSVPGAPFTLPPFKTARFYINNLTSELVELDRFRKIQAEVISVESLGAVPAESYGVHYNASPARNVAQMSLILSQNRVVSLTEPGQYMIGGPDQGGIIGNSNNTIIASDGVELILADQTYMPLISNKNAFAPPVLIDQQVLWELAAPTYQARIVHPGIHLMFPLGSWIGVLGLPGTDANNRGFQGVWQVRGVALDTIRFHLNHQPPNGGNSAASATIYRADSGIHIFGGLWDGNKSGQQGGSVAPGEMRSHIQGFRNCQNIIVKGTDYRRGHAWSIGSNNVRDVTISDIECDLFDPTVLTADASAVYQMSGGARNVLVERITAACGDNMVAGSLDVIGPPGTDTYVNHDPGDTYDITIRDIHSRECNASPIAFWGNVNYMHHSILVERITGKSPDAMVKVFCGYPQTNLLNTNGGSLTIRDISGASNGAPVLIHSDGTWDTIDIDGVRNEAIGSSPLVNIGMVATPQTLRKVTIKNVCQAVPGTTFDRTQPVVLISNTHIEDLQIEGSPSIRLSAGVSAVVFVGTQGSISKATVSGVNATAAAEGDCFVVSCENTNPTALGLLTVRDCGFTGVAGGAATGGLVRQATTGRVTRIRLDNSPVTNAENASGIVRDNVTGGQTAVLDTVSVVTT